MRIALGAVLVFAALWFVALRPKPVEPIVTDPVPAASADATANAAAKAAEAKAVKAEAAQAKAAKAAAAKASSTKSSTAKAVLADLDAGRTIVLLVWDGKSADDRSVRRAVSKIDRHDGSVRVHVANVAKLSSYEAITKGVPITESPTVLVIDADRKARVISGLTVKAEIDDAVGRALKTAR
jgi:hypothetical protein